MKIRSHFLLSAAFLALLACEGPTGPAGTPGAAGAQGPQGPQGPQGQPGTISRFVASAILQADGQASASFGAAAGSFADLPALTCYMANDDGTEYWVIGAGFGAPICGVRESGGTLQAFIFNVPTSFAGRAVRFVAYR